MVTINGIKIDPEKKKKVKQTKPNEKMCQVHNRSENINQKSPPVVHRKQGNKKIVQLLFEGTTKKK